MMMAGPAAARAKARQPVVAAPEGAAKARDPAVVPAAAQAEAPGLAAARVAVPDPASVRSRTVERAPMGARLLRAIRQRSLRAFGFSSSKREFDEEVASTK